MSEHLTSISTESLMNILDYSSDEIYVLDNNLRITYVNKVCERHYGLKPDEITGQPNDFFTQKGYWTPSIVPLVLSKKERVTIEQTTHTGTELITTAIPIMDVTKNNIKFIVITARQKDYVTHYYQSHKDHRGTTLEHPPLRFIGNDEKMKQVLSLSKKVANVDANIMIQGETGTGKSMLARHIHQNGNRRNGPFLAINCAALPEDLLEAELFGYMPGAFTGATRNGKMGLLEAANHGTVLLDEIGEISLRFQAKILQVIQEQSFFPVGGRELKHVDVRIISATNANLLEKIQNGQFREDLYYRLNVIDILLPPLRERKEDINLLARHFLQKYNNKYQVYHQFSEEVMHFFRNYYWPGNIRQLENIVERLVITSDSTIIEADALPAPLLEGPERIKGSQGDASLDEVLTDVEKKLVIDSYRKHKSSRKVAQDLAISQTKASKLIRKYCRDAKAERHDTTGSLPNSQL